MHKAVIVFAWIVACLNGIMGMIDLMHDRTADGLFMLAIGLILVYQLSKYRSLRWNREKS